MSSISPFLWFNDAAEEAAKFYVSLFPNSSIGHISYYGEQPYRPSGSVMTVSFVLDGQPFTALNGGPVYQFNPAISFFVNCATQEEVDRLWEALSDGGKPGQCGWIEDKFGITWQIVPKEFMSLMGHADKAKVNRMTQKMFTMSKLDLAELRRAFEGE